MKYNRKILKKLLKEDSQRFLHGFDHGHPVDEEGKMAKSRLHRVKQMSKSLCDMLEDEDQLPGWVQDHLAVAHENLSQVFSYLEPAAERWENEDGFEGDYDDEDEDDEDYGFGDMKWHDAAEWGSDDDEDEDLEDLEDEEEDEEDEAD